MAETRKEKLLKEINLKGKGLELGPLCWPLLSKKEAHIEYVDHVSRAELLKIYKDDKAVLPKLIPEVDYPLNGKTLRQAIPRSKTFDYILASHVIEHVPDMVRWFQDLSAVLNVGGVVSLAIPDKRYTFDIDRRPSEISDVMGAYIDSVTRPSSTTVFDYTSHYRANIEAQKIWDGELYLTSKAPHRYSLTESIEAAETNKKEYVDTHCFVFTPYSFFEILRGLIELDLFDFKVVSFWPTAHGQYEFLVSLKKVAPGTSRYERATSIPIVTKEPALDREYEAKIKQLENNLQMLNNQLVQKSEELRHLYHSLPWRVTKPLRYVSRTARKVIKRR